MKMYEFEVVLIGIGSNKKEAWKNAKEQFEETPSEIPDTSDITFLQKVESN